ncbi:MAG: hypothetical protein HYR63_18035 [Proteobacteria bacterium]|nr:hypothetical protein [Pseudomonadota bacterium]MBI3496525.1 hypothetical protein [Pseudomonadota bacterium]
MSRLVPAIERLDKALLRLEAAIAKRDAIDRREREALKTALADARAEYARLAQAADSVSNRLDGAIGRLKLVMEG